MSMRIVSIWVGGAALLAVSAATAALLLPSCEVALPFGSLRLGSCPGTILQDPLAEDRVASAALRAEIRSLEARLAGLDCPAPVAAPLPAPEPLPEPAGTGARPAAGAGQGHDRQGRSGRSAGLLGA
ncbi:hypothetical protein ACTTAM_15960 [Rhodobacter capsulatus]|uniref:hypothetical protein n=1 Tax=Rhodobacter capsulatus TaxID=1061 RepID=UPI004029D86F